MQERIENILRDHHLVEAGDRLLVAVSGGADSIALLHILAGLAGAFPFSLVAAHLDHCLRPESANDAEFVRDVCQSLQVPAIFEVCDVAALARDLGSGLEDAGRRARRDFLERTAASEGCRSIALAHHADDQAETVLYRMTRGSGISGLAAMRRQAGPYIRPLLDVRRIELTQFLQQNGIVWREDASNRDPAFARNRLRHLVMPQLEQVNPKLTEALLRLSRQAADEEEYWHEVAQQFVSRHGRRGDDGLELDIAPLLTLSRGERRRYLRFYIGLAKGDLQRIDACHVELIETLVAADRPQADLDLPGLWVGRRYDRLVAADKMPEPAEYLVEIHAEGTYRLPTGDRLQFSIVEDDTEDEWTALFPAETISFPLQVRSPRSGDRFQPSGMQGSKLLKDYFIDAKMTREERRRTPLVCWGDTILWLAGRRRSGQFRPAPDEKVLKMRLLPRNEVVE